MIMGLTRHVLEHLESKYPEEDGMYEAEVARLESLPVAFQNGEWSREDLEWIIEWKVRVFTKPILKHLRKNDEGEIRARIEEAVHEPDIRSKVEALTSLNGIGVPVASAILMFIDKDQFTVIDKRAWNVLYEADYLSQELSDAPTVDEYLLYLGACWTLANEYDVSLRTLDRALWVLDIDTDRTAGD